MGKSNVDGILILEGILFGIIGILFFTRPIESYFNFTEVAGILIVVIGIFEVFRAFKSTERGYYIFSGIINIVFGLIVWLTPIFTTETLILFYGVWAIVRGVYLFIVSIKRKEIGFNLKTVYYIVLVILGLFILTNPILTLLATPYIIGTYFIVSAIFEIYLAFQI